MVDPSHCLISETRAHEWLVFRNFSTELVNSPFGESNTQGWNTCFGRLWQHSSIAHHINMKTPGLRGPLQTAPCEIIGPKRWHSYAFSCIKVPLLLLLQKYKPGGDCELFNYLMTVEVRSKVCVLVAKLLGDERCVRLMDKCDIFTTWKCFNSPPSHSLFVMFFIITCERAHLSITQVSPAGECQFPTQTGEWKQNDYCSDWVALCE